MIKIKSLLFFRIILPLLYITINYFGYWCGEGIEPWSSCMQNWSVVHELSHKLNPLSWLFILLGKTSLTNNEVIALISGVFLLFSYLFGVWWYYFIGKQLDKLISKLWNNKF